MPKVVFLCKGTRGDVLPLLSIALTYQELHKETIVVVVCSPSTLDARVKTTLQQELDHRIEIWDLPEPNLDGLLKSPSENDQERLRLLKTEAAVCLQACREANLIVYNLFSLEGHFIANHLSIPCIAASPHLQMRAVPTGFKHQLSKTHPEFYQRLLKATPNEEVSYAEVDHWMWRMFLDDYGCVCESLGLPVLPFSLDSSGSLPPPTALLYGISPAVISRQPYWPQSVSLCGFWNLRPSLYSTPDSTITTILQSLSNAPLYVGFGSMESYLHDTDWTNLFATLEEVMEVHAMSALFQCQENGPITQAHSCLETQVRRVHLIPQAVSHDWLFPQCSVILHHGGSGTVATSLLSARPQIISPVMFDQTMWAEHLSWMGVAYQCPLPGKLSAQKLSHALKYVMEESVRKRVKELSEALHSENGVTFAVDMIEKSLEKHSR